MNMLLERIDGVRVGPQSDDVAMLIKAQGSTLPKKLKVFQTEVNWYFAHLKPLQSKSGRSASGPMLSPFSFAMRNRLGIRSMGIPRLFQPETAWGLTPNRRPIRLGPPNFERIWCSVMPQTLVDLRQIFKYFRQKTLFSTFLHLYFDSVPLLQTSDA